MSNGYWKLASGAFKQDWSDTSLISGNDDWSKVPSIVGYRGDGLTSLTGVDPRTITGTSAVVNVIANQTNPNTLTTGGVAEFQIANPVVALQGSGTAAAPYLELFMDATGQNNITLSFDARDIDGSTDNAVQQIAVQYRLGDGSTWTNVPGGYIADATTGPSLATLVTPISVVLPSLANNAATLQVRIMTTNAVGNDEWVGIDNIAVTGSTPVVKVPGALSIADASVTEGNDGTHPITFTVSRIGGADGAVDAHYAVTLPGGATGADAGDFAPGTAFSGTVHFDDGQATATIALPVQGDTTAEFDERFTVALSDPTGGATITRGTATGTILNDDVLPLLIGQIQGAGHTSPVNGQTVVTQGVVTGVDTNGYYLQDYGDGDTRTSDGVFVYTGGAPTDVYVGDFLSMKAVVGEFQGGTGGLTVTELTKPEATLISWGNALPDAVVIGESGLHPPTQTIDDDGLKSFDPTSDGIDFWESLEGMRVTLDHPMAVSNTTTDSFAETWVVASDGRGATGINDRGGITLAADDNNPEKIQIERREALSGDFAPHYTVGDQLSNVTGIISYAAADYQLVVTEPVTVEKDVTLSREVTNLSGDATHLSLATYNLENYDPSDHKDAVLASNIVTNLHLPDIVGVEEVQDADGAGTGTDLSGATTAQGLIDAIYAQSGAHYAYVEIAPSAPNTTGGEPNGNIRSGFFYNTDRVGYVDGSAQLITGDAYNYSRKPLVAQFTFNGQTVTAIDVHLTARSGSDSDWGANQPPAAAGDASRTAQAAGVQAYVQSHLAADPSLNIAVLGDWNGFSWENAQTQLTDPAKGGKLTDLNTLLPSQERYSYLFDGNAQQLDHILVTPGLLSGAQYDSVHINSQFTADDRPTDHDPQLAILALGGSSVLHTQVEAVATADDAGDAAGYGSDHPADAWMAAYLPTLEHALHVA